jgi:hypothetical protein
VLSMRREVAGIAEADGGIEVHAEGFRAERARPYALVLVPGRNAEQIRRLASAYRIEVVEVGGAVELLEWCTERGLGLSAPVVRDLVGPIRRPKSGALRLVAALAVVAALVFAGIELIPEQESGETLRGRGGEIQVP